MTYPCPGCKNWFRKPYRLIHHLRDEHGWSEDKINKFSEEMIEHFPDFELIKSHKRKKKGGDRKCREVKPYIRKKPRQSSNNSRKVKE